MTSTQTSTVTARVDRLQRPRSTAARRDTIASVVRLHGEEAALLRATRTSLVRAPHVAIRQLGRHDERIAAHLDGLLVAGPHARDPIEPDDIGSAFVATAIAIAESDADALERAVASIDGRDDVERGVHSAFGWSSTERLRGVVTTLLGSRDAVAVGTGLVACDLHRVDPGPAFQRAVADVSVTLRRRALRGAGRGGRVEHLPFCLAALDDDAEETRIAAAWAALLLGDRDRAVEVLESACETLATEVLGLLLKVVDLRRGRTLLAALVDRADLRKAIRGVGASGDPRYGPWLIDRIRDPATTRIAGEAFSLITNLDLAVTRLDRPRPADVATGPDDDPANDDVALDEDDGLPWPNVARVTAAWLACRATLIDGRRAFCGHEPTPAHCIAVLRRGTQRQRAHAAEWLCLLRPGTPLFNTAAPAWRQHRLLDRLS